MSSEQVDEYLSGLDERKRASSRCRRTILEVVPEADQVISYGLPAFRLHGETVAGFAAFKTHLSYLPFSGSVLGQLGGELEGYQMTRAAALRGRSTAAQGPRAEADRRSPRGSRRRSRS